MGPLFCIVVTNGLELGLLKSSFMVCLVDELGIGYVLSRLLG